MSHSAALPFTLSRSDDVVSGSEVTSTRERLHGLLRLDGDRVVIQWRTMRTTERVGREIRTDREMGEVREIVVPLSALAGARVRRTRFSWTPGAYLHLTAADLRAFEEVAGPDGLRLKHPAELVVRVSADAHLVAQEFAAELQLALAERAMQAAEQVHALERGEPSSAVTQVLPPATDVRP